jgi:hypothetical protein
MMIPSVSSSYRNSEFFTRVEIDQDYLIPEDHTSTNERLSVFFLIKAPQ